MPDTLDTPITAAPETVDLSPIASASKALALVPVTTVAPQAMVSTAIPTLAQPQREAIVDLLILGIYADQRITLAEQDFLHEIIEAMGWDELNAATVYLQRAWATVRASLELSSATDRLLTTIRERLDRVEVMQYAIEKFSTLLSLQNTTDAEGQLLDQVMEHFFALA
ncbi:MAG: hypothetical protein RLZZ511_2363 [Cyanobacteriota bacterium]|jgi:hypothetical protein